MSAKGGEYITVFIVIRIPQFMQNGIQILAVGHLPDKDSSILRVEYGHVFLGEPLSYKPDSYDRLAIADGNRCPQLPGQGFVMGILDSLDVTSVI